MRASAPDAVGVLLAAGASRRAGGRKALAKLAGETLVGHAVRYLCDGGCARVIVVVAAPHEDAIVSALGTVAQDARPVRNPHPEAGMLASLKVGLGELGPAHQGAVVVALVDQPRIRPTTVKALLDAFAARGDALITPSFGGRRGHPYLVAGTAIQAILAASPSAITRHVLAEIEDATTLEVADPAILEDADTLEDLLAMGATPES